MLANPLTASLSYSRKRKLADSEVERDNPTLAILNPGGRMARHRGGTVKLVQSERVYEIRYRHAEDGKDYKHEFSSGVSMYTLESGAVLLQRLDGQPLWEDFD